MMPMEEPKVARVLLRVEMADGQFREFDAVEPYDVELTVNRPGWSRMDDGALPPSLITAGEAASVTISLKADGRRPASVSTEAGNVDRCTGCGASSAFWQPQHRAAI